MTIQASTRPATIPEGLGAGTVAGETSLREMANAVRALAMDAVQRAKPDHLGMHMGMADVATVLFTRRLKFDPGDTAWPDRDRSVLSAGHGQMLIHGFRHLSWEEDTYELQSITRTP